MSPESLLIASLPSVARTAQTVAAGVTNTLSDVARESSEGFLKLLNQPSRNDTAIFDPPLTLERLAESMRKMLAGAGVTAPFSLEFDGAHLEVHSTQSQKISDALSGQATLLGEFVKLSRQLMLEPFGPQKISIAS